jgi:hypothetical protein
MKTFKEFCKDANIQEGWMENIRNAVSGVTNRLGITKPQPKPKPQPVLAYKTIKGVPQQGFGSGANWKPGRWNERQKARYGWEPVKASSYSKADTPGSLTASGHKFDDTQRLVAVPWRSSTDKRPSVPFGTKIDLTMEPRGTNTTIARTTSQDTGNFGPAGEYNKTTMMDLSLRTAKDLLPIGTSIDWGKRNVYRRLPQRSNPYIAGPTSRHQGPVLP